MIEQLMIKHKADIPGIGMRIIKSAIAVSLCMIINLLRGENGMVFYSQLAALWCIQMYRNNTISNASQRMTGTVVGAVFGLIYLLLYPYSPAVMTDSIYWKTLCIFWGVLLVIYTTVLIHKKQASYFSCVVFLSIVINHIGDINPYRFVWNRFLDTVIGILIGLMVNNLRICINPDRKTLFVSGVDDILVDKNNKVSAFSKVELNRMIEDGMKFTLSTMRTPASVLEPLSEINLKYPIIVMDGAALYDVKNNEYLKVHVIPQTVAVEFVDLMEQENMCPYINVIIDDTLLIYYSDTEDEVNRNLVSKLRSSPYRNYIKRSFPGDERVVYFMMLDKSEKVESFYNKLISQGYSGGLKLVKYPANDQEGYYFLKIYSKDASKENMLAYLKNYSGLTDTMTFGTVTGKYDVVIRENDFNEMVKRVRKAYEPFPGILPIKSKELY